MARELITENMKPGIKVALAAKYVSQLEVKLPKKPDLSALLPTSFSVTSGTMLTDTLNRAGEIAAQPASERKSAVSGDMNAEDKKKAISESISSEEQRKKENAEKNKSKVSSRTAAFAKAVAESEAKRINAEKERLMRSYNESLASVNKAISDVKDYFSKGGGSDFVNEEVKKVNTWFDELCSILEDISQNVSSIMSMMAISEVIVTGTAAGMPNPASKIVLFMDKIKKISSDLRRAKSRIQDITNVLLNLGVIAANISAMAKMIKQTNDSEKKIKSAFSYAVAEAQKRKDWTCDTYDTDENSGQRIRKAAGYMVPRVEVDYDEYSINLLGYRCYCTVYNGNFIGGYRYGGGEPDTRYGGSSGQRCYYITAAQMNNMLSSSSQSEISGVYSGISGDSSNASFVVNEDGTTTLKTNDGRIIKIDKEVSSGDTVKLNTGEIISIL